MDLRDIEVLYEDNHLIAVNKQGGWLVHGDETGDPTLQDLVRHYIKVRYNKPGNVFCGVIHRIDRPVSGIVIFARTSKGLQRMNQVFQNREIQKNYLAVTTSRPEMEEGRVEHYLVKDKERNVTKAYNWLSNKAKKGGKKAISDYKLLASLGDQHLVEVKPITGRPHQIRVQLKELGSTIKGDLKYGYNKTWRRNFIYLHCNELSFMHPIKKVPVTISAPPPNDQIWNVFKHIY